MSFSDKRAEEPLFLAAKIQYRMDANKLISMCVALGISGICILSIRIAASSKLVNTFRNIDNDRIEKAAVLAVPLLSIKTLADAVARLEQVREARL